nr:hypothetical protein BaRGS_014948 [Batillaria attramentaria]
MTSTIQSLTSTSSPTEAQGVTDGPFRYAPLEFLGTLPGLSVVLIVVLVLAALVGTFGNLLILVAVATNKELQNVESVFVVNLACCDLYVTLIADPLSIVG